MLKILIKPTGKKGLPANKALNKVFRATEFSIQLVSEIPEEFKNSFSFARLGSLMLRVQSPLGEKIAEQILPISIQLADELNIPHMTNMRSLEYAGSNEATHKWLQSLKDYGVSKEEGDSKYYSGEYACFPVAGEDRIIVLQNDSPIWRTVVSKNRKNRLWENTRESMRAETADYLEQFKSTAQIRQVWPEMLDYLPAHIVDPGLVIKLPALTTSRLNERLGISK
jgi:hypothetical protein